MRTLVIADPHGFPYLIENAMKHAGKVDKVVFLGDYVDIGPDPIGVLDLVDKYGDEVLVGNHDLAAIYGIRIQPQDYISFHLGPRMLERIKSGAWKAATIIDGVVLTHAGVGTMYKDEVPAEVHVANINQRFKDAVEESSPNNSDKYSAVGDYSTMFVADWDVFWLRPRVVNGETPNFVTSFQQLAGHTPNGYYSKNQLDLMKGKLTLCDPYARETGESPLRYGYAIIEGGVVSTHYGILD